MYGDFTVRVGADLSDFKSKMDDLTKTLKEMQDLGSKLENVFSSDSLSNFSSGVEKAASSMEKMSAAAVSVSNAVTTLSEATSKVGDSSKSLKDVEDAMKGISEKGRDTHKTIKDMGDAAEDFGQRTTKAAKEAAQGVMTLNEKATELIENIAKDSGKDTLQLINEKRLNDFRTMGNAFQRGLKDAFNVESLATMLGNILGGSGPISRAMGVGFRSMYMEYQRQQAELKKLHDAGTNNSENVKMIKKGAYGAGTQSDLAAYEQELAGKGLGGHAPRKGGKEGTTGAIYGYGAGKGGGGAPGEEEYSTTAMEKFDALRGESASTIKSLKKKGVYQEMEGAAQREGANIKGADASKSVLQMAEGITKEMEESYKKAARGHDPKKFFDSVGQTLSQLYKQGGGGAGGILNAAKGLGGALAGAGGIGGALKGIGGAASGLMGMAGSIMPALGPVGMLGSVALSGIGAGIGSLATSALTGLVSGIGDATKAIMGFAAEAQQAQFELKKAFGNNSEWMSAQASAMTKGTAVSDSEMAKAMSTLGMSLGDKLGDSTIASLAGTAARMGVVSGKGAEGTANELSMAIMSGRPQSFRQIKKETGIDIGNEAVQKQFGIKDEEWKKMSDYEQMMKRVKMLESVDVQKQLRDQELAYYDTINGQMKLKEENQKRVGEAFKEFGNYMLPIMKAENGALEIATATLEPFAKGLKGVVDGVGKSTGISDFVGGISKGLSSYEEMAKLRERVNSGTAGEDEVAMYNDMTKEASGTTKTLWGIIDKVKGGFEAVSNTIFTIIELVGKMINFIKPVVGWFAELFGMQGGGISDALGSINGFIQTIIAAFKVLFDVIGDPEKSFGEKLVNIAQIIIVLLGELIKTIVNILATGLTMIVDVIAFILKTIVNILQAAINLYLQLWADWINLWIDIIKSGGGVLIDIFDAIMSFLNDVFSGNWGKILDGVTGFLWGIVSAIGNVGKSIIDAALGIGTGIWNAITGPLKGLLDFGKDILGGAFDTISNVLSGNASVGGQDSANEAKSNLDSLISAAAAEMEKPAEDNKGKLKDAFNTLMDGMKLDPKEFQLSVGDDINSAIDGIAGGLKDGINGVAGGINGTVDTIIQALAGNMADAIDAAKQPVTTPPAAPPVNNETPIVPPATTDELKDAISGLNDTVAGKKMDSKIEIYITQTFEGDMTQEQLQQAGATAEEAVMSALLKRGIIGQ